jgi:glycosidase
MFPNPNKLKASILTISRSVDLDHGDGGKFSPRKWEMSGLKRIVNKWQTFMINNDGWNALYLENHDQSRSVSRWGSDLPEFRAACAKMFATFLALQSGTVFVYQGQELGLINLPNDRPISDYRDLETLNAWREWVYHQLFNQFMLNEDSLLAKYPDDKERQRIMKREITLKSRDNARTPMQVSEISSSVYNSAKYKPVEQLQICRVLYS